MTTKYPAQIDTNTTLPQVVDTVTAVKGKVINDLIHAIITIESELGVKPSSNYGTVKARLDTIENAFGNLEVIELDGDLGGILEEPKVIGIQGRPVNSAAPQVGQALIWDGLAWTPKDTTNSSGIRAVASSQPIPSQASEPGWYVIGDFYLGSSISNAVTIEVIGGISDPSVTLTVRLFSIGAVSEVSGSRVNITSIPDVVATANIGGGLAGGSIYQVQAQAISAFPGPAVFAMVKSVEIK